MSDDDSTAIRDELLAAREIIQQQRRSLEKLMLGKLEPIAIVGTGLRSPGSNDTLDEFDAQFFDIPAKQAPFIDPAQRILLETAWEALENANIDPTTLGHDSGAVYIGASPLDLTLGLEPLGDERLDGDLATGMGTCSLSVRLSSFLGWRGPSLTTDTACASSLTALHLAVEGLRRRECEIALCGAVDARAEGCGVLVLKRLSDAWHDGDTVLAIVRGTAIGQDGEGAGLTAPSGTAQEAVMRAALAGSRLTPGDIQYVETHGAGTPLGDPVDMASINRVFGAAHGNQRPTTVGSRLSDIGIGAIIKVVLQLRAGVFYPAATPTECRPWEAEVRRAVVNGFGVTGAIGVAVLEEAPRPPATGSAEPTGDPVAGHVFTLSAKSAPALRHQLERYRQFVAGNPHTELADLCYTSNVGRAHFRHRLAGGVRTRNELMDLLDTGAQSHSAVSEVAFLFTGAGSEHVGMGQPLYDQFPEFRARVDECEKLFFVELGRSITDIMFDRVPDAAAAMTETRYAHATLFTLEYALACLWRSWGVHPTVLIGHSVGELVAATVAGVFSLADGVAFLSARARLLESVATPGGMAAVAAPAEQIALVIEQWPDLAIAAVNSPRQCVVSGSTASLMAAFIHLTQRGLHVRPLHVATGFHSPVVSEIAERLRTVLEGIEFHEPALPVISNLTGKPASTEEITTPDYWVRHVTNTVDFAAGMAAIGERGEHVFLEIGPSHVLTTLARQCLPAQQHRWLASLSTRDTTGRTVRDTLAELYTAGLSISWHEVHSGRDRRRLALPLYAFDRRPHWLPRGTRGPAEHPLLGRQVQASDGRLDFASAISATYPAYLADHRIDGQVVMPAGAYVEILLALADVLYGDTSSPIENIRFHEAMFLSDLPTGVRTRATSGTDARWQVEIASGERTLVTATLTPPRAFGAAVADSGQRLTPRLDMAAGPDQVLDATEVYTACARAGLDYGPRFRRVTSVTRYGDLTISELAGQDVSTAEFLPPPIMDGVTHGLAALVDDGENYVATGIARIRVFKKPRADTLRSVMRITPSSSALRLDALLFEGDVPVMELSGMSFARPAGPGTGNGNGSRQSPPRVDDPATLVKPESTRMAAIADIIRHTVVELLSIDGVDRIDEHTTFFELGVDSLVAIDLKNRLESRLYLSFPILAMYEQPSVGQLAEFLGRQLVGPTSETTSKVG